MKKLKRNINHFISHIDWEYEAEELKATLAGGVVLLFVMYVLLYC